MGSEDEYRVGAHTPVGARQDKLHSLVVLSVEHEPPLVWNHNSLFLSCEGRKEGREDDVRVDSVGFEGIPNLAWYIAGPVEHLHSRY